MEIQIPKIQTALFLEHHGRLWINEMDSIIIGNGHEMRHCSKVILIC